MLKFLFVIVGFFFLLVFLMGFSVVRMLKNILFGSNNSNKSAQQRTQSSTHSQHRAGSNSNPRPEESSRSASHKKIFTKDEGEYVDYEEVK